MIRDPSQSISGGGDNKLVDALIILADSVDPGGQGTVLPVQLPLRSLCNPYDQPIMPVHLY